MNYAQAVSYLDSLQISNAGLPPSFRRDGDSGTRPASSCACSATRTAPCPAYTSRGQRQGSTAAILDSVLSAAGYRTGLFTSPHLVSLRERVRVGGEPIPEQALADCVELVQPAHESVRGNPDLQPCTFFEAYLGIAALHFLREKWTSPSTRPAWGRLDATNPAHAAGRGHHHHRPGSHLHSR